MNNKTVIIGNGIAGISCAIALRKISNQDVIVISEESDYFFSRTALMYVYMGHMKFEHTQPKENHFWNNNNIELVKKSVSKIHPDENEIEFKDGSKLNYDNLVLATGSKSNKFGWPGQDLKGVTGLYHKQDLDFITSWSKKTNAATIVGGGLIGIELAEMLKSQKKEVHFLVRETNFWRIVFSENEANMIDKHIINHGVDLQLNTELKEIYSNDEGEVRAVKTSKNQEIECQLVGLAAGVSPNIEFIKSSKIDCKKGVIVNEYLQTNYENIYAIGDCAELSNPSDGRKSIEAVWYTGRMMGETLAKTLSGIKTPYRPGYWFNSAKFFDIEYQTYGHMPADINEQESEFYWEYENKAVRMVYDKKNMKFLGINTLGIRMRHAFFENALQKNFTVLDVIQELPKANFDPEFYKKYEPEIQSAFKKTL